MYFIFYMKKIVFLALATFITIGFFFVSKAHAQAASSERWVCLDANMTNIDLFHQTLTPKAESKPMPNTPTYIVECVGTESSGQICTTGRQDADLTVYKKSNLDALNATGEFTYYNMYLGDAQTVAPNPVTTDNDGNFPGGIIWHSFSAHLPRKFLAMNYYEPAGSGGAGGAGALQQATFTFEAASMAKDCVAIQWDPFGRVFDSQTLEPVSSAKVTLLFKKNGTFVPMTSADLVGGNLVNPQTTKADGAFSFVVPDGDYKLQVAPYQFISLASQVHSNYTKAYSELYPFVPADIDGVIQERGAIQHRDIPITSIGASSPVKMLGYFYEGDRATGNLAIEGSVSHPLTKIIAKSVKVSSDNPTVRTPYREIASTTADNFGRFFLEIKQSQLESTAEYSEIFSDVELQKVDLRTNVAQGTVVSKHFEPIPQYIEGKAVAAGAALPNTTVEIYKDMSNKPFSTVKTDAQGNFKITSEYLPLDPYNIRYVTAQGKVIKSTTSDFIAANQKTIFENKTDLYSYRDIKNNSLSDLAKSSSNKSGGSRGVGVNTSMQGRNATGAPSSSNQQNATGGMFGQYFSILVGIIVLLIVAAGAVVVMIKKKSTVPTDPMV
jgi:hypothetical protein